MEFILKTDLSVLPQTVEFNCEELKNQLAPKLAFYKNLVVTENGIKDAKMDKANLNKLKDAIETKRKEVKKQLLLPYDTFEKQCKEIVAMIDEPVKIIDKQIKAFDEIRKNQKYSELQAYFDSLDKPDFVKMEFVLNPKWGNVTAEIDTLKAEMSKAVADIIVDYSQINAMYGNLPIITAIRQKFAEKCDKSQTLVYASMLEHQYKEEQKKALEHVQPTPEPVSTVQFQSNEPLISGTFKVTCTKSQLISLRDFMKSNNIHFELVK